jgi:hypothetical protein
MDALENSVLADPILLTLCSIIAFSIVGLLLVGIYWLAARARR